MTLAAFTCMASSVASITPPHRPRQPAWAAPTTVPSRSASSTGRQSAVITAHTTPGVRLTLASATGTLPGATVAASTTAMPCTCCSQAGSAGSCWRSRARLAATLAASSPTWSPRFRLAYGAGLTPPWRVVIRLPTLAAVGQSAAKLPRSTAGVCIGLAYIVHFHVVVFVVLVVVIVVKLAGLGSGFGVGGGKFLVALGTQQRQQLLHVVRQRRFPAHLLTGSRVHQGQG